MTECYFIPDKTTTSATICVNCGKEKAIHTIGDGIKVIKQEIYGALKFESEIGLDLSAPPQKSDVRIMGIPHQEPYSNRRNVIDYLTSECRRVKIQRNEYEKELMCANREINRLRSELELVRKNINPK